MYFMLNIALCVCKLGSIRMKKIWVDFTLYVLNNFHMRGDTHIRPSMIKGRS